MSDLPELLRELSDVLIGCEWDVPLCSRETCLKAAQKIERLQSLLDRVFVDPSPVSETAGAHTEFAYFWRKDWLKLKAEYEAAKKAAGGE